MHRTNIYFAERHWKELNKQAKRTGISVAELIQRVLDAHPIRQEGGQAVNFPVLKPHEVRNQSLLIHKLSEGRLRVSYPGEEPVILTVVELNELFGYPLQVRHENDNTS